jgi:hypothetical protein
MNKPIHSLLSSNGPSDAHESPERRTWLRQASALAATPWLMPLAQAQQPGSKKPRPTGMILCYSRFADTAEDAQTVRRATLAAHFKAIKEAKANVISMVDLVAHHAGRLANLPPRPIVLSVDDCDRSIVDVLMRQMQGSAWPVTLYITPTTVGKGKRALTWDDLSGLHHSGRFSVQARTFSGIDLVQARKDRSPEAFDKFAFEEMESGRITVEQRLVKPVSFQAWPAGAHDKGLMAIAAGLGFHASVALGDKPASLADPIQGLSRFAMHDGIGGPQLKKLIQDTYEV